MADETREEFSTEAAGLAALELFWEAIQRVNAVGAIIENGSPLAPPFAIEFCYLQFRKVCELLALMSIVLHGDLPKAEALKGEWNAEQIMKRLYAVHDDFYPRSSRLQTQQLPDGRNMHQVVDHDTDALGREELNRLYAECAEMLHRGRLKGLKPGLKFQIEDRERIDRWQQKLVALLNGFRIARAETQGFFLFDAKDHRGLPACMVIDIVDADKVNVRTLKAELSGEEPFQSWQAQAQRETGASNAIRKAEGKRARRRAKALNRQNG